MKVEQLLEAVPKKVRRSDVAQGKGAIVTELERIFKLDTQLTEMYSSGGYVVRFSIPASMDADEIEFTAKMITKKLPALFEKHKNVQVSVSEPRIGFPRQKSMKLDDGRVVTMAQGAKQLTFVCDRI